MIIFSLMSYKEFVEKIKPEFEKVFKFLEAEIAKLRTSRASPSLVEDIEVDCFGSKYALKQLAAISCPRPNQIVIQPWDISYLEPIEKAILKSGLGMSSSVDKNLIRLSLPMFTQEHRENIEKIMNEKAEQVRQSMRRWRDESWNQIQQAQKEKKITEDDKFRGKNDLQKLIDDYNAKIKDFIEKKSKEIM